MLVNLTPRPVELQNSVLRFLINEVLSENHPIEESPREGIHILQHWNPEMEFVELSTDAPFWENGSSSEFIAILREWYADNYPCFEFKWDYELTPDHGVCDNYEQILARWPHLEELEDEKFAITMVPILKETQEASGGWRWHKWGEYIGSQDPQAEYIFDEPLIEKVYTFQVFRLRCSN